MTFYESVVTFCTPSRRRLAYYLLDCSTLRDINGISLNLSRHNPRAYLMLIHLFHLYRLTLLQNLRITHCRHCHPLGHRRLQLQRHRRQGRRSIRHPSRLLPPPQPWRMLIPLNPSVTVRRGNATGGEGLAGKKNVIDRGGEVGTGDHLIVAHLKFQQQSGKASPAVKATPVCRPSGLHRVR